MVKHIGLRMAKASQEDIDGGFDLAVILDAIDKGDYPSYFATPEERDAAEEAGNIPSRFDEHDFEHLQHLHGLLTGLMDRRRGFSLWRVVMGMDVILRNNVLDPDDDCLAIHPRFAQREQELCATVERLRQALSGLVGVSSRDELQQMEIAVRALPAPEADKVGTINAIHALLASLPEQEVPDDGRYYLQDSRSYTGNCPMWWAKGGNGYVTRLDEAHRYTLEEAMKQHRMRETDIPWPCAEIDALRRPTVDIQHMRPIKEQIASLAAPCQRAEVAHG